jgi:ribose transport system permease protein
MSEGGSSRGNLIERWGPVVTLVVLVAATAIYQRASGNGSTFLSLENLRNILADWSFIGIIALGMTFVIISGGIDLSVGSLVAFAGGAGIWLMNTAINAAQIRQEMSDSGQIGLPLPYSEFRSHLAKLFIELHLSNSESTGVMLAVVATISLGVLAGTINGSLIARGGVAPFIATLGGLAAYRSMAMAMIDGGTFDSASPTFFHKIAGSGIQIPGAHVGANMPLVITYPVIIFLALACAMGVLLNKMRFGRYVIAMGANEHAARYSGVNIRQIKFFAYVLIGGLTGISALLIASRTNSVSSSSTGQLYELDAIAAVVVGGTRMTGGSGTIFGTVIGVLILGVIGNMLNFLDVSIYLQGLVKGGIIVAAALVQQVGRRKKG